MNGKKSTICDDKVLLTDTGVVFTFKGDILSMITDYDFNKTPSPDANHFLRFFDEMHFDIDAKGISSRDKTSLKLV